MKTRQFFKSLFVVALIAALLCPAPVAEADWFKRFKDQTITNKGSSWSSQQRHYYSGGGISIRNKHDSSPLLAIQPPRFEAGCGGIDVFWGGFSFLDPDMLIEKFKNILQAAPAYAFDIALTQLCQTCANILKTLEAIANELNSLVLDDCAMAQALANYGVHAGAEAGGWMVDKLGIKSALGEISSTGKSFHQGMGEFRNGLQTFRSDYNKFLNFRYGCDQPGVNQAECHAEHILEGSLWAMAVKLDEESGGDYKLDPKFAQLASALFGDIMFTPPDGACPGPEICPGQVRILPPCEGTAIRVIDTFLATRRFWAMSDDTGRETMYDFKDVNILVRPYLLPPMTPDNKQEVIKDKWQCSEEVNIQTFFGANWSSLDFGSRAVQVLKDVKGAMINGTVLDSETIDAINTSAFPIYSVFNILNLRMGEKSDDVKNNTEEMNAASLLAAGMGYSVLSRFTQAALDILALQESRAVRLAEGLLYKREDIQLATVSLRTTMKLVNDELLQTMSQAQANFRQNMDEVVKAQSMKKIFQQILIERLI